MAYITSRYELKLYNGPLFTAAIVTVVISSSINIYIFFLIMTTVEEYGVIVESFTEKLQKKGSYVNLRVK